MNSMSDTRFDSWKHTRELGRSEFIIKRGILRLGIPAGLAFGLVFQLGRPAESITVLIISVAVTAATVALFGGSLWGLIIWLSSEHRFLESLKTREEDEALRPEA